MRQEQETGNRRKEAEGRKEETGNRRLAIKDVTTIIHI
jgi:hypothetical protein